MRTIFLRPAFAAAAVVAAAGVLAAGLALRPAIAGAGSEGISPDGFVKCVSTSPCQTYKNTDIGAGLEGINLNPSAFASGLIGQESGKYGTGVTGRSGPFGNGVAGSGGNTGVSGTGGTWGVYGYTNV